MFTLLQEILKFRDILFSRSIKARASARRTSTPAFRSGIEMSEDSEIQKVMGFSSFGGKKYFMKLRITLYTSGVASSIIMPLECGVSLHHRYCIRWHVYSMYDCMS